MYGRRGENQEIWEEAPNMSRQELGERGRVDLNHILKVEFTVSVNGLGVNVTQKGGG